MPLLLLRQASRTDSIYTLRPAGPNYKRSVFCFGRKKSNADEAEAKHRTVVPNHTGKAESELVILFKKSGSRRSRDDIQI